MYYIWALTPFHLSLSLYLVYFTCNSESGYIMTKIYCFNLKEVYCNILKQKMTNYYTI